MNKLEIKHNLIKLNNINLNNLMFNNLRLLPLIKQEQQKLNSNKNLNLIDSSNTEKTPANFYKTIDPHNRPLDAFPQNSQIGTSQNVSQVVTSQNMSQVVTSPQISQIIKTQKVSQIIKPQQVSQVNLPDPEPVHYISESKIISESQVLPEISTSQISASKVLPLKVIPQITRTNEVLPMKVLPTIDQGTFESTYVENIPQITQINNNNINANQSVKPIHSSQISENLPINNSINNLNSKNNE